MLPSITTGSEAFYTFYLIYSAPELLQRRNLSSLQCPAASGRARESSFEAAEEMLALVMQIGHPHRCRGIILDMLFQHAIKAEGKMGAKVTKI